MPRLTLLILATWLMLQPAALAFEFRSGDHVVIPAGTTIQDDLYVTGSDVRVEGTILGDLVVAGGEVTVTGDVRQDLIAAGGQVDLRGKVGQSVRAAGGTVKVSGTIGKDVLLAGGNVNQETTSRVAGDGAYAGGNVNVGGKVGTAMVAGGDVTLRGKLGATNVHAGTLALDKTARIDGPLSYTSEATADIAPGAVVTGGVTYHEQMMRHRHVPGPNWGWWVFFLVASLVSGAAFALLLPRATERVSNEIQAQPLVALLIGFAIVVGLPVALLFLMITVVGIPLALVLLGLYVVTWHIGWLAAGLTLGEAILRRRNPFKGLNTRLMAALALGVGLLVLLGFVPWLGWIVGFLAVCVGFGGIAMAVARSRAPGAHPPAEPPAVVPLTA